MAYKKLIKVSNVCQLLDKRKYVATTTVNGVAVSAKDNAFYVTGTCIQSGGRNNKLSETIVLRPGRYYFYTFNDSEAVSCLSKNIDNSIIVAGNSNMFTVEETTECYFGINFVKDIVYSGYLKPQIFDLTEMYGAGHEPKTVEQFRQDFPEEMYDYSPRCWATSYKRCLKVSNVCQLLDKSKYYPTQTNSGITFTNNGDGTITVNGTATGNAQLIVSPLIHCKDNHKYLVKGSPSGGGYNLYRITTTVNEDGSYVTGFSDSGSGNISNALLSSYTISVFIDIYKGQTVSNLVFKPQLFDLTEMYGAGHEPTTVEQFRADFPNELYDYKPYSIIPSYQRNLTCKTKNLFDISKYAGSYSSNSTYELSDNSIKLNITGKDAYVGLQNDNKIAFEVEPNTTYYFSCDYTNTNNTLSKIIIGIFNNEKVWTNNIFTFSNGLLKGSFTTNDSTYYLSFRFGSNSVENEISTSIFSNIMVVKGSNATDYVPYGYL